jgi:isopenicillin-N epimerase
MLTRRSVIQGSATVALVAGSGLDGSSEAAPAASGDSWDKVRALFDLSPDKVHMSSMLIAAHPRPVREAIEWHRRGLDRDPVDYLRDNAARLTEATRSAAAGRLGVPVRRVALTDSTTAGVGLVYTGLDIRAGQHVLATDGDYYVTHESLRLLSQRTGASVRRMALGDARYAEADAIADRVAGAVEPGTRLVALTWVHSSTGLKMPVAAIADRVAAINAGRDEEDAVLIGLDAVHGFAVEAEDLPALGVDYLMAGCHKWLFGPRGTGVVGFSERGLSGVRPTIPSFDDPEVFSAWYTGRDGTRYANNGRRMTPGGFKAFEHRWALAQAFELHERIGRDRVGARTHELARALKEALAGIPRLTLHTPEETKLSSGIVAFDVEGITPEALVTRLGERGVVASVAPYPRPLARLTPSVRNSMEDVERAAAAVRASA